MTKKEYILKILEAIKDDWEPAKGMILIILELEDELFLENIYQVFNKTVSGINNKKIKNKIQTTVEKIKEIQLKEQVEKKQELKKLEEIERSLGLK